MSFSLISSIFLVSERKLSSVTADWKASFLNHPLIFISNLFSEGHLFLSLYFNDWVPRQLVAHMATHLTTERMQPADE